MQAREISPECLELRKSLENISQGSDTYGKDRGLSGATQNLGTVMSDLLHSLNTPDMPSSMWSEAVMDHMRL